MLKSLNSKLFEFPNYHESLKHCTYVYVPYEWKHLQCLTFFTLHMYGLCSWQLP